MVWKSGILAGFVFVLLLIGCDIYEKENKDWPNEVTINVNNLTNCLVDLYLDGLEITSLNPGESYLEEDAGQGVHLIVAFPWNDERNYCDLKYTSDLKNGDYFRWNISPIDGCGTCDPTPTPEPTVTPTPEPI